MTVKDKWLDEGLAVLIEDGAPGIRIDRIAERLGLSKGSFHHHFAGGTTGYRTALLQRYESDALTALGGLAPTTAPGRTHARWTTQSGSRALRPQTRGRRAGLGVPGPEVRATQERVDSARLAALERLWLAIVDDPRRAHTAALLPHLLTIGASVALPPIDPAELDDVFGMLVELIRPVTDADG